MPHRSTATLLQADTVYRALLFDCVTVLIPYQAGKDPKSHWCELCRAARANPFWEVCAKLSLGAFRLRPTNVKNMPHARPNFQTCERAFSLIRENLKAIRNEAAQLQVSCEFTGCM